MERRNDLMAVFSQANLEAVGGRDKIRLCPRCGLSLEYISEQGYCCPKGHGCWWPQGEQKVIREPPDAVYAGGAIEPKGVSKGRKRKKNRKEQWISDYIET